MTDVNMSKFVVGQVYVEYLTDPGVKYLLLKIEEKTNFNHEWTDFTFLVNLDSGPVEATLRSDGLFCTICEKLI